MGHVRNYTVGDAIAWYKRLKGFNVLHPIGWDSFGQPAEDAAVKRGVNPRSWTEDNISVMRGQLERLGLSYDWRRQMAAHRPEYYKWDQWFFLKMYEMGLAYKKLTQVNCGYCKRAMMDMMELMKADPKLKVVLKEFPVLSQGSVEAAQVGVAIRMQDPTGKKYLDFHQKLLTGRGAADKARAMAVAKEVGLDMGKLEKDLASAEVRNTLEENMKLAEAMGMNGTPSYVIGKQVVIGAVGVEALREKISNARCGKATC